MPLASNGSSPCAACKLLRRRCAPECVFAPHFAAEQPHKFAIVHRVFGASNINKMLQDLAPEHREDAVSSLVYEAEARFRDPVYGCVGAIASLQQQVVQLQVQLALAQAETVYAKMQTKPADPVPGFHFDTKPPGSPLLAPLRHGSFDAMAGGLCANGADYAFDYLASASCKKGKPVTEFGQGYRELALLKDGWTDRAPGAAVKDEVLPPTPSKDSFLRATFLLPPEVDTFSVDSAIMELGDVDVDVASINSLNEMSPPSPPGSPDLLSPFSKPIFQSFGLGANALW